MPLSLPNIGDRDWGVTLNDALDALDNSVSRGATVLDVHDFGAVGDGLTDDTPALAGAIEAAPAGSVILLRRGKTYRHISQLLIDKPVTVSGFGARVATDAIHLVQIMVTSSDVTLEGFELEGPGGGDTTYDPTAGGIHVVGPSFPAAIQNIRLRNLHVHDVRRIGIYAEFTKNVVIEDCTIERAVFAGVSLGSVDTFRIQNNIIDTIYQTGLPNSYGMHLTRNKLEPIADNPLTSNGRVVGNKVRNVPEWEGIDTHGGQNIYFGQNEVTGCFVGFAIVSCPDENDTFNVYAPKNVTVEGNYVNSGVTDGSVRPGIQVQGAQGLAGGPPGTFGELATGCKVIGNTVIGHGEENDAPSGGGIQAYFTRGIVIANNVLQECSPSGIDMYRDNYGSVIIGNTIIDAWSNTLTVAAPIWIVDDFNNAHISGNRVERGPKVATQVNTRGIFIAKTGLNVQQSLGPNDLRGVATAANRIVDTSATCEARLEASSVVIGNGAFSNRTIGFYGATGAIQQAIGASPAADVTALKTAVDALQSALLATGLVKR